MIFRSCSFRTCWKHIKTSKKTPLWNGSRCLGCLLRLPIAWFVLWRISTHTAPVFQTQTRRIPAAAGGCPVMHDHSHWRWYFRTRVSTAESHGLKDLHCAEFKLDRNLLARWFHITWSRNVNDCLAWEAFGTGSFPAQRRMRSYMSPCTVISIKIFWVTKQTSKH